METVLLDEVIETDYGQLDIVWSDEGGFDGEFDRFFAGQVNGLVGATDPDGVYVNLARRSGGSQVRMVLNASAPDAPDASWEDVVEVSVTIPAGSEVQWMSWAGETSGEIDGIAGDTLRMRVSARGRDAAAEDEFTDEVLDEYLIELWSAPHQPDAILRVGSESARYWHKEVGSAPLTPSERAAL